MNDLSNPIFHDEAKAREWLEKRLWANGPICPKCGVIDQATLMQGESHRPGLYQCNACREPFTVTVNTLYERSKVPLNKWLAATHLMMASKKGVSALQVGRMLGLSKKTAWFLCHRIRESLRDTNIEPLGGSGKTVEFDETYVGGKERNKHASKRNRRNIGGAGKEAVFALVERGGKVRSHHVSDVSARTLRPILEAQLDAASKTMSDDGGARILHGSPLHQSVNHSIGEYVRGDAHTNTIEGYFSIMKRGITGVYHHVSPQHLKRYLAEFDYRYNERSALGVSDAERMSKSVQGIVGKRLTYRTPHQANP
ncbi:MAG TPA: IS1595 family transposase [Tepidisphaeraceae bacterium]|jgi:transposase-like protein|nr:IS1595 family transposase [Tepidisphaeraceae bacterium]